MQGEPWTSEKLLNLTAVEQDTPLVGNEIDAAQRLLLLVFKARRDANVFGKDLVADTTLLATVQRARNHQEAATQRLEKVAAEFARIAQDVIKGTSRCAAGAEAEGTSQSSVRAERAVSQAADPPASRATGAASVGEDEALDRQGDSCEGSRGGPARDEGEQVRRHHDLEPHGRRHPLGRWQRNTR